MGGGLEVDQSGKCHSRRRLYSSRMICRDRHQRGCAYLAVYLGSQRIALAVVSLLAMVSGDGGAVLAREAAGRLDCAVVEDKYQNDAGASGSDRDRLLACRRWRGGVGQDADVDRDDSVKRC